ncbi:hypothetical protein VULLAG_LOCUS13238 [Vulpes lagopus]
MLPDRNPQGNRTLSRAAYFPHLDCCSTKEELCDVLHRSRQVSLPQGKVHFLECWVKFRVPASSDMER